MKLAGHEEREMTINYFYLMLLFLGMLRDRSFSAFFQLVLGFVVSTFY